MRPMKVLVIAKNADGGIGKFLQDLSEINNTILKKIEIKILVLERPQFTITNTQNYIFYRKKNFYPQKYSFSFRNFIYFVQELFWIKKNVKKLNPEILMGLDLRCNFLVILFGILSFGKFKTVASTHADLSNLTLQRSRWLGKKIFKFLIHYFYNNADVLICVSKHLSLSLKKDFDIRKRVQTVYNGINYKNGRTKQLLNKRKIIILSVARLSCQKDHQNLFKAINIFNRRHANYELWIVGDGPEKKHLLEIINELGLINKVKFLGWVDNVNYLYNKADIFVLSSIFEGFSYVLIEAMSHGLPVISTNSPYGPSEIVGKNKYGLLVPVGDAKKMEKAISLLVDKKSLYEHYSAQSIIRSAFFSKDKMLKLYIKMFADLSNRDINYDNKKPNLNG